MFMKSNTDKKNQQKKPTLANCDSGAAKFNIFHENYNTEIFQYDKQTYFFNNIEPLCILVPQNYSSSLAGDKPVKYNSKHKHKK